MRQEHAASVARALIHRCDLDLFVIGLEIVERELQRCCDRLASDLESPACGSDFRDVGEVIANIEGVVGRELFVEIRDRRLVVRWPPALLDQRDLAGQGFEYGRGERPLGQLSRTHGRVGPVGVTRHPGPSAGKDKSPGRFQEIASRRHASSRVMHPPIRTQSALTVDDKRRTLCASP